MTCWTTQPETVSETLRLPLRAVVASSSAMRSSRSAQQFPPRSAADALPVDRPPAIRPAAANALRLYLFITTTPVCFDLRNDRQNEAFAQHSSFRGVIFPVLKPVLAANGFPPESPPRAMF